MQVCATTNHFYIRCKYVPPLIISLSDASMCHHKSFLYQMQVCAITNHFFIRCKYVPPQIISLSDASMCHHKSFLYQMQVPLLIGLHPYSPSSHFLFFPFLFHFYNLSSSHEMYLPNFYRSWLIIIIMCYYC